MATPKLTLGQKMQNDMQRTGREVSQMKQEGQTLQDPNASQRKTPVLATAAGATMAPPPRTRQQAIGRRPVFRSQSLAQGAPKAQPLAQQQGQQGRFDMQSQDGQALSQYLLQTAAQGPAGPMDPIADGFNMQGPLQTMQQQPMTAAPLAQGYTDPTQPVSSSIFDGLGGQAQRFETNPNVGSVQDGLGGPTTPGGWVDRFPTGGRLQDVLGGSTMSDDYASSGLGNDINLPDPNAGRYGGEGAPDPGNLNAGGEDPSTRMEFLSQWLIDQLTDNADADKDAARERADAATSQMLADAQSQMGSAGFYGSTLMPSLSGDIQTQQQRALAEELLGIDQGLAQQQLQAGGLLIDQEGQMIQREAFDEAMELARQVLGGGGGEGDAPPDGPPVLNEEDRLRYGIPEGQEPPSGLQTVINAARGTGENVIDAIRTFFGIDPQDGGGSGIPGLDGGGEVLEKTSDLPDSDSVRWVDEHGGMNVFKDEETGALYYVPVGL